MCTSSCFMNVHIVLVTIMTIGKAEIIQSVFDKNTIRVSDVDYDTMFTDAGTIKSRMRCIAMCITSDSNTYYDVDTGQCSCQSTGSTYSPVTTGSNYVDTYDTGPSVDEGDWTFIQRRVDASVSFERLWNDYVAGFGDVDGNYWIGLEMMHQLTSAQPMRLQVDIEPYDIPPVTFNYQQFIVGDAISKYQLIISGYSSSSSETGGDPFDFHNGSKFSTPDQDNDSGSGHCASNIGGGWWYSACYHVYLNGIYQYDTGSASALRMRFLPSDVMFEPLRKVSMKIKATD